MKSLISLLLTIPLSVGISVEANPLPYRERAMLLPKSQTQTVSPARLLEEGLEQMREFLAEGGADDPARLYTFLEEEIAPYFDFDRMAAWVSRPYYQQMTDRQRIRFRNRLQEVFFKSLAQQIGTFSTPQPRIDFLRPQRKSPQDVMVSARVLPAKGYPMRLTFHFQKVTDSWRVIDAASNGRSAAHFYRQHFLNQVRRHGLEPILR